MLLGMSLILQVTASPPTPCVSYQCLPHMFMILVWPLKAFEFEISISWATLLPSTTQMSLFHRTVCLVYCSCHFSVTSVLLPWLLVYSAMALGEFFNFSSVSCLPLQPLLVSLSLTPCFCQIYYSCSHLRALAPLFSLPITSTGFVSSSKSQLRCQLLEGFFSWIPQPI